MCLENRPRRSEKVYYHGDNGSLGCVDWIHGWSEAGIFLLPWWLETIMLGTEIQIGNSGLLPPTSNTDESRIRPDLLRSTRRPESSQAIQIVSFHLLR